MVIAGAMSEEKKQERNIAAKNQKEGGSENDGDNREKCSKN
jgi:hypothetical protein